MIELNSNLTALFSGESLSGTVDLNNIYANMSRKSMKVVQINNVTDGTGLPAKYYAYSVVFMVKGPGNYGMMLMYSLSNPSILYTKLIISSAGTGDWYQSTRTADA